MPEEMEQKKKVGRRVRGTGKLHMGYMLILRPTHPRAHGHGYIPEHIEIAEAALGRFLPDKAEVHHVNGLKADNRGLNLVICENRAYHKLLHYRADVLALGGNPDIERYCSSCKAFHPFESFHKSKNHIFGRYTYCKTCQIEKARAYRHGKRNLN